MCGFALLSVTYDHKTNVYQRVTWSSFRTFGFIGGVAAEGEITSYGIAKFNRPNSSCVLDVITDLHQL